jgi:hypothetical protein
MASSSTKSNGSISTNGTGNSNNSSKLVLPPAYDLHRSDRIHYGGESNTRPPSSFATTEDSINSSSIDYYSSSSPGAADEQYEGFRRVGGGEIETSLMPPLNNYSANAAADHDPTQLVQDIVSHSHHHQQQHYNHLQGGGVGIIDPYFGGSVTSTAEDATATIHSMHSKLLYLLSHPELFHDALTWEEDKLLHHHQQDDKFEEDSTFEGLSDTNKATQDETFEFHPHEKTKKNKEGGALNNIQHNKKNRDDKDHNNLPPPPPLPFEIFAPDAEVVLPQALTATQLFGVERETGIELEAAAGIYGLSLLFLRWLALMPEGDHMNVIRPPGLTVMRIAGGGYRVTAAHRVVWRWMNKFSFSPLEELEDGSSKNGSSSRDHSDAAAAAAVNEGRLSKDTDFDFGDLVTMTIIDVFETDVDGKLLSYCPTFDNRAVHKTKETVERLRKGASQIKERMEVIAKSPAGKRVNKAAGQVGRMGMTAALRVGSMVKSKIEEIGTDELKKQAREGERLEEMLQNEIISPVKSSTMKETMPEKEQPKQKRSTTDRGQGYISDDSVSSPSSPSRRMEV